MNTYLVEQKICYTCRVEKLACDFGRQRSKRDGLQSSCKECKNAMRRNSSKTYRKPAEILEDYRFLRSHNVDHYEAARRLRIVPNHLMKMVADRDCRILEPAEQACYDRILVCIERGKTFSLHDMPLDADEQGMDFTVAVNIALRRGLVEPIGKRVHVLSNRGNPVHHYRPVAVEIMVAA